MIKPSIRYFFVHNLIPVTSIEPALITYITITYWFPVVDVNEKVPVGLLGVITLGFSNLTDSICKIWLEC